MSITNHSGHSITAWVVSTERRSPDGSRRTYRNMDSVLDKSEQEIIFRDTHRIILGNQYNVYFGAAIFEDGSFSGDQDWVKQIVRNRKEVYQDIAVSLQKLRSVSRSKTSESQLVKEFRDLAEKRSLDAKQAGHPRLKTLPVFEMVFGNLERTTDQVGTPVVMQDRVEAISTDLLGIAQRIMTSRPPITTNPVPLGEPLKEN